ncbi:YciI family protein [Rugamonas sp.]|uniref:YciI family protein n=1 Tax=Rugamonas sp. TaxID=1926287 RepID=UPI0025E01969|nr:YciI family protein [Rugamonas sp.]
MEFVLTFQQPADIGLAYADPVQGPEISRAWGEYMGAMATAGVLRSGKQFDAGNASAVSVREGRRVVRHAVAPDAAHIPGGYVVIDVGTLEEALMWAERSPSSVRGCTEVWPGK